MESDLNVGRDGREMFLKTGKASSRGKDLFLGLEGKKYKRIQLKLEDIRVEGERNPTLYSYD